MEYLNQIKTGNTQKNYPKLIPLDVNTVRNLSLGVVTKPSVVIKGDIYDKVRMSFRTTKEK
jgi:hypothetical protein